VSEPAGPAASRVEELTAGPLLRRNVVLNMVAWALPAAAALVSIPLLSRGLDPGRFGLLALAWAAVGIFSLFDFGLGRSLTRMVAERLAHDDISDIGDLVWAASWVLLGATGVLAIAGFAAAPTIVDSWLDVPPELRDEAVGVVRLLALAIPPLSHGVALRGVLEAAQKFGVVNRLRVPLGIVSYAGPLVALPLGADARIAVAVIVVARTVYWLAHFPVLWHVAAGIAQPRIPSRAIVGELARVGGWITVSNIVSPIIVQADRVVVATTFPIAASGWYGAASEVATKQWLFPAALGPVFFSAAAASLRSAPQRAIQLMERSATLTLQVLLPAVVLLTAFAEPGLQLWLGSTYVPEAAGALRWLAIAVYVNSLGQVAYFLLQGGVDARAVAYIHLVELPLYLALLAVLAMQFGVVGVAAAWTARMVIDTVVMWVVLYRRLPEAQPAVRRVARLAAQCVLLAGVAAAWGASR
jgi:O-antigen/teichoic acid export membrane protein